MILLLLFIFVIIIGISYYYHNYVMVASGAITQNKKLHKGEHLVLANKNFDSFVDKRNLNSRLIYITGPNKSGKMHLAKLIAKKNKYEIVDAKGKTPQEIRRQIKISDVPKDCSKSDISREKARIEKEKSTKKYIIVGKYLDDDLKILFKGKGYNRNFIFLYVQPQTGCEAAFGKALDIHGEDKKTLYAEIQSENNKLLKDLKEYRIYIVKNCYK